MSVEFPLKKKDLIVDDESIVLIMDNVLKSLDGIRLFVYLLKLTNIAHQNIGDFEPFDRSSPQLTAYNLGVNSVGRDILRNLQKSGKNNLQKVLTTIETLSRIEKE